MSTFQGCTEQQILEEGGRNLVLDEVSHPFQHAAKSPALFCLQPLGHTDCCPHHGKRTLPFTNICLFLLDRKGILMAPCTLLGTTRVKHQLSLRNPTLDVVPHGVWGRQVKPHLWNTTMTSSPSPSTFPPSLLFSWEQEVFSSLTDGNQLLITKYLYFIQMPWSFKVFSCLLYYILLIFFKG